MQVLDHGKVVLLNISGISPTPSESGFSATDRDVAKVARISFNNLEVNRTEEQDLRLAEYLLKHKHSSPWEFIEVWLEMELPLFTARQLCRHRTAVINECSARYIVLPDKHYIPRLEVIGRQPTNNKQGRELVDLEAMTSTELAVREKFLQSLESHTSKGHELYSTYIEEGIPAELARLFVSVNIYTHWVWKQDLRNMFNFLSLRLDSHAQYEAREYARAIYDLLQQVLPNSMKLFDKYCRSN